MWKVTGGSGRSWSTSSRSFMVRPTIAIVAINVKSIIRVMMTSAVCRGSPSPVRERGQGVRLRRVRPAVVHNPIEPTHSYRRATRLFRAEGQTYRAEVERSLHSSGRAVTVEDEHERNAQRRRKEHAQSRDPGRRAGLAEGIE